MKRISSTNAQFLAELIYFIWLLAIMFIAWENNFVLATAMIIGIALGFALWHHKEDIVFFLVGALLGSVLQIIMAENGIITYANPGVLNIPCWVPLFYGSVMMFAKRFKDSFFEMEHWRKHYEKVRTIKDLENQIFPELMHFILLVLIVQFLSYSNIAATVFLFILLMLQLMRWHTKEDYIYALVLMVTGFLVEIIAANIGIWEWSQPAILGIPLWIGLSYKYLGLITRRICVTLNHKLFK